jgi:hypothetical protein
MRGLLIPDIFKMVVISLNLFQLFPLYPTSYFVTEELGTEHSYPVPLKGIKMEWETWQRYSAGYDLTANGKITCDDIVKAVKVLEKYYRYNYWLGNRVAVALHNFWNALFVSESTLAFVALVTIIETFTNVDSGKVELFHNAPKLVPLDAHGNAVTKKRLEDMYEARSTIAHGSYGRTGPGPITWARTHLDAKFSNVDVQLSSGVMSIVVKMLHRVLFDARLMSLIENAKDPAEERRLLRGYLRNIKSL